MGTGVDPYKRAQGDVLTQAHFGVHVYGDVVPKNRPPPYVKFVIETVRCPSHQVEVAHNENMPLNVEAGQSVQSTAQDTTPEVR
jgi:hypothetical protein